MSRNLKVGQGFDGSQYGKRLDLAVGEWGEGTFPF